MPLEKTKDILIKSSIFLLIWSISWLCSGVKEGSMFAIAIASMMFLSCSLFINPQKIKSKRTFKIECVCLIGILLLATIQLLNNRSVFFQHQNYSYINSVNYITWLPSTILSEDAVIEYAAIISAIIAYLAGKVIFSNTKYVRFALKVLVLNTLFVALLGLYQVINGIKIPYGLFYTQANCFASFYLENAATSFIYLGEAAAITLFIWRPKVKSLIWLFIAIVEMCIMLKSDSRGSICVSILILLIGIAFLISLMQSKLKYIILFLYTSFIICLGSIFSEKMLSNDKILTDIHNRLQIQNNFHSLIKNSQLYGTGIASFKFEEVLQKKHELTHFDGKLVISGHLHNDILEFVLEFGFLGLAIAICFLACYIYNLARMKLIFSKRNMFLLCCIGIYLAHSCFDIFLHISSNLILLALILAIASSKLTFKKSL